MSEGLTSDPIVPGVVVGEASRWLQLRGGRSELSDSRFRGQTGAYHPAAYTISSLNAVNRRIDREARTLVSLVGVIGFMFVLFVGFNRRWSDPVASVREYMAGGTGPLVITYRVNAGQLPDSHW